MSTTNLVPVQSDLTSPVTSLSITRGIEKMLRVDQKISSGLALVQGEWGVLQSDGTVARPGATPVIETYLCFCGTDRYDVAATGQVTLIMNSAIIAESSKYNAAGSYAVGTELTVKSLGSGQAGVTPATSGEYAFAKVLSVGQGTLTYEVYSTPRKMA